MLKDHKRRQQAARRGEAPGRWRLYETAAGKVPKELEEMFSGIPNVKQVKRIPKVPALTKGENSQLKSYLRFIETNGVKRLERVTDPQGEVVPKVERISGAKGPLLEMKVKSFMHNPRFIYVDCNDVAVFLDAFKKKTQKLLKIDIERSDNRYADLKSRGECS